MKNVLILDNSKYVTGAGKSIATFTRALAGKYKFYWAVTRSIPDNELAHLVGDNTYQRFEFVEISKRLGSNIRYLPQLLYNTYKLRRMISDHDISIVHVNDCYNMCGVLVKILNRKVRLVYHVRLLRTSFIGKLYSTFIGIIGRYSDAIICCSNAVSNDVGPLSIRKQVIYDSEFFTEIEDHDLPLKQAVKDIVYVGNILPGKGQDLAIKAFDLIRKQYPDLKLRFIGKFDHNEASVRFKEQLDVLIDDTMSKGHVAFEGFKYDIDDEIKKADILLNLSESESFSMVCLEALKAGVPLVASDCGGPAELFEHMRSGWLVPNRDFVAAAEAVNALIVNRSLRERFSTEGKKYVFKNFNVWKNAKELNRLYDSV